MFTFNFNEMRPNFFLHLWHFFEYNGTDDIETWFNLVTEKSMGNYRVFDIVKCIDSKAHSLTNGNTYISYGDGKDFESAKDNAAVYFMEKHKKLNYLNAYNTLKDIIPSIISIQNAYSVLMTLVKFNFIVKPTIHYCEYEPNHTYCESSMHIKSLGLFTVQAQADTKEEIRNLLSYIYICKFMIKDGEKYLEDIEYKIVEPEKYPYNEVVRITGYFQYSFESKCLLFFDERKSKEYKPRIKNILTEEMLKSDIPLEQYIIDACKVYQYEKKLEEPSVSEQWARKNEKYFKPMDEITEADMNDFFPKITIEFVKDMAKFSDLRGMTVEEAFAYFKRNVEIEKAQMRKTIQLEMEL